MKYLSWHMHKQDSSNGSLSLAVSFFWSVQSVGLKNTEQVLLPVDSQNTNKHNKYNHIRVDTQSCFTMTPCQTAYPCPPRDMNISWKGNCRCRSFSITSSHLGSPGWLSSSCPKTNSRTKQSWLHTLTAMWAIRFQNFKHFKTWIFSQIHNIHFFQNIFLLKKRNKTF